MSATKPLTQVWLERAKEGGTLGLLNCVSEVEQFAATHLAPQAEPSALDKSYILEFINQHEPSAENLLAVIREVRNGERERIRALLVGKGGEMTKPLPHSSILTVQLYRSLERLSLAIETCAKIGFEESSPTKNAHHASVWNDLNDAQKDAKLKLKHFREAVERDE